MKQSQSVKNLIVPTLIFSMMTFLSCGHKQSRNGDELFSGMEGSQETSVADNKTSEMEAEAKVENTDLAQATTPVADPAAPSSEEGQSASLLDAKPEPMAANTEALTIPNDKSETKIELAPEGELASTPAPATQDVAQDSVSLASTEPTLVSSTEAKPEEMASPSTLPAQPLSDAPTMLPMDTTASVEPQAAADTTVVAQAEEAPAAAAEAQSQEESKGEKAAVQAAPRKASVALTAPSEPVWQAGLAMNRFYFVRSGDNTESVSSLLYGNADHSADLKKWNSGSWKTGRLIVYRSGTQPEDTQMKSFYQERGLATTAYVVKAGDWLSTIAAAQYGDAGSWKEIAALNSIESPDQIAEGHQLNLYPAKFDAEKLAKVEAPAPTVAMAPKSEVVATNTVPNPEQVALPNLDDEDFMSPAPQQKPVAKAQLKKDGASLAGADVGTFFTQNLIWVALGAAAMGIFYFIRRYRKARDLVD